MSEAKVWTASRALATAFHPSTSKDHVLPRLQQSVFVERKEVMKNFVSLERMQSISDDFFDNVQSEVTPAMRIMLLEWMFEVCDEERCSCEIFPLAVSYIDRFLSVESVHKRQLQALGTACLFIASKVKLISPFTATRLVEYTDEAVPISELLSWEMLVLDRLNWDVSTLTALDFLDQFVHRLKLPARLIASLRPYLNYLVPLAMIDFPMATLPPSVIAAACLQVAATHITGDMEAGRQMMESLNTVIDVNLETIEAHATHINHLFVQKQNDPCRALLFSSTQNWCSSGKDVVYETANDGSSASVNGTSTLTPTEIDDVVIF